MDRAAERARLRAFLEAIRRPDAKGDQWRDDDPLVTSGLIDSLAVLEIISYLESEAGIDFSATGVEPENLRSVNAILDLIERRGTR
jgi:acyl carrier protein